MESGQDVTATTCLGGITAINFCKPSTTTNGWYQTVTFATPFSTPPSVLVSMGKGYGATVNPGSCGCDLGSVDYSVARAVNVTASGFDLYCNLSPIFSCGDGPATLAQWGCNVGDCNDRCGNGRFHGWFWPGSCNWIAVGS